MPVIQINILNNPEHHHYPNYRRVQGNLDSGVQEVLLVESEFLGFGIRNPTNNLNPESKLLSQKLESRIHGLEFRIQDCLWFLTWGIAISRIINVKVWRLWPRLITLTEALIILDITKTYPIILLPSNISLFKLPGASNCI